MAFRKRNKGLLRLVGGGNYEKPEGFLGVIYQSSDGEYAMYDKVFRWRDCDDRGLKFVKSFMFPDNLTLNVASGWVRNYSGEEERLIEDIEVLANSEGVGYLSR